MAKRTSKSVQPVEGVFSDRPLVPKRVEEPEIEENVAEPSGEEIPEEPIEEEPVEYPAEESNKEPTTAVIYDEYKLPKDPKEKGIILTIILSILILLSLGFLIYYERSWRLQEQEVTIVDSKLDELRNIVKGYVGVIHEPNKAKYCKQISEVYREASKSKDSIDKIEDTIMLKNREILGFEEDEPVIEREYEWQALLSASGIIHTWLTDNGIVIDKSNQREVFTAIAEGFE